MRNNLLLPLLLPLLLVGCAPTRDGGAPLPGGNPSDAFGRCGPDEVLGQTCSVIESELLSLEGWCDFAQGLPLVFRTADDWNDYLARCDTDVVDPLVGEDWSTFDVVGGVLPASGCEGTDGTHWVADCGTSQHLGYWSTSCGACQVFWVTTHLMRVPEGAVESLVLESCVPEGEECPDAEAG